MNTEKHYADGGEPHYKRVARLGLSWCRANITKYAERTKGSPIADLIKVIDYAIMELEEGEAQFSIENHTKLKQVAVRFADLIGKHEPRLDDGSDPVARGYVNQDTPPTYDSIAASMALSAATRLYQGNEERRK